MRPRILYCLSAALVLLGILGCYSPGGSGVSGQASLAPGITAQPQSQTVALNGTATFQVTSTGLPLPSYQWERSNDGGATWSPVPGATGTSYALANAAIADNQAQFHVVLSDPAGSVASTAATLTVSASTGASQVVASLPPGSVPTGITTGPDGNLWFTNSGAGQIGKLDSLTHQVALINLPDPTCKPVGITTGPDGNLWFTEQAGGKLGVMTTAGALNNEFPVGSGPTGIITGSDGNLWVTLLTGNQIAKVNVAGVVSLFSLPTAGASPSGITLSPDGSIWFTETAVAQIGEISPAGAILEWSVQTPAGGVTPVPMGITSTPDGAIWYSDGANNCIGKFVPSNPVPLVRLPGSLSPLDTPPAGLLITIFFPLAGGANPNGLTTDVQGQVWVTEQGLNEVAVVTLTTQPGTTPGSYPLPLTGGLPVSLVLGPDGNIWVTLPGTNDVVMVVDLAPTNQVSVLVLPVSATVVGNGTQNFSAIVTGTPTPTVTWSVLEPGGGSITPDTGIYAAPSMAGTYHVVATSNAVTPPVAGEAAVTVTVPTISAITPPNPTVQGGGVVLFSAQVSGLGDDSIVWSASDGVMIPTTGVWTAPYTAETVTITATSNVDAALTATTQVLIPPSGTAVPIITTPPASLTVSAGSTATFTVVATGATTLIYQWQVSINGGSTWSNVGTGAASYTTPGTTAAFDGYLYQVVVGNGAGASVTSGAARLTVTYAPVITTQPLSQGVIPGSKATFLVAANGEPAPTFAWQLSQDGGNTWAAVTTGTGGGSPIYTTAATLETDNGNQYRVIVSNGIGSPVTSNVATLTLAAIPFGITTTPANQTVVVGNPATFTVSAYGPALTYQWQVSTDGGNTWSPVGTPSATLSLGNTTPVQNGYLYQVTVTDGLGASATAEALLTVTVPAPATPTITLSAVQAAPLAPNLTASVGAQPDASYAWTVTNGGIVSGQGTTGITFSAGSSGTVTVSCVVTNADSVPGSPGSATVTIVPVPTATVTMSAATYTANNPGYPGTASVPAQSNCTFLWTPVNGTITYGQGTNSITFTAGTVGIVTMQCTVTSAISGPATGYASSNVVAEVDDPAVTVSTPSMTQGQPYTAFVTPVSGAGYSWSLSTGTIQSGQNTSSITFTAGAPGGLTVICTITNAAGTSGLPGSNATATIYAAPTAALAASANNMLPAGGTVTLTPTFTGGTATVGTTGTGSSDVPGPFTSGSGFTSPTETVTTTFTLTVTNPAGTQATANQTINVAAATPSVTSLTASDWRVAAGQSATFTAAVQGYPGVNVAWWVSPDNGTTWYSITSSPWQFNSNGTVLAGFLPGTMGGNVCVAGTPSSGVATLGVYNLTTTLTLSNLPQTATLLVEVTASFGVTLPTSAPFTPPSTGLTGSASVNLVVEPATFSSTLLAAGDDHLLLLEPGQNNNGGGAPINYANYIWSCGRNDLGQLGNFTQTDSYPFQFVQYYYGYYQAEVPSIVLADAAGQHSVALDTQGNVYWWGNNTTGQIGAYPSLQAQTVSNVPSMVQYLVDNATSTFSLQADHTIWSWNAGGTPTQVTNFTGSYFLIATADADSNGTPYLAALDTSGNLWEGTASGYPGQLDTPTTLVGIFARGDSSLMGLDVGGNVWTWTVPASSETAPTQIPFAASPAGPAIVPAVKAVALAKGPGFLLAQDSQGGLWVYGTTNNNGQLGVTPGTLTNTGGYFIPVSLPGLSNPVNAIAAGRAFAAAEDTAGNLWTWGFEGAGAVGYSGYGPAPTSIQGPTELRGNNNFPYYWYPWTNQGYTGPGWDVPVGSHSDVIYEYSLYNQFYIWGTDPGLYLGATPAPSQIPLQFSSGYLPQGQVISSAVAYHALLVDPSANLWAWGRNSSGQLGQNSTSPLAGYWQVSFSEYPAPILKAATGAAHSLALDASNNLWAWGNNASGQLGLSGGDPVNTTNAYVPMQVSANLAYSEAWTACAAGTDFSVGLTTHGVWVWGANEHGQIGLESGPDANLYVPTKLSFYEGTFYGTAILQVAAGAEHILALDANGNVWTWGAGQLGQLGTGSIGDSSYPAPVLGPQSDFDQTVSSYPIVQICAGANFCLALDSAGNLWGWGDGATGALPTGNTPQVLTVATQLSIPFTAVWVTATADSVVAVDQYGDFWTWGWNQGGGLGADPNDPYSYAYVAAPTPISLAAPPYDYIPGD